MRGCVARADHNFNGGSKAGFQFIRLSIHRQGLFRRITLTRIMALALNWLTWICDRNHALSLSAAALVDSKPPGHCRQAGSDNLIDRCNHHLFQPLLTSVATAGLSGPSIAAPIRHIFRGQRNLTVLMGESHRHRHHAALSSSIEDADDVTYDYLIVAAGATHSYFGNDAWAAHAPGLKTLEDAFAIRRRVLLAFEHAERETDEERRRAWLTFAVIGAGATGVELAGTLAEISRHTLTGEFRRFDSRAARVLLLEGACCHFTSSQRKHGNNSKTRR